RRAHMDDLGVKQLDRDGRVVSERRFVGLFTSKAHAEEAAEVPLLRRTLRQILAAERVVPGSHDHKAIVAVFNALPKSELFASTPADLRGEIATILAAAQTDDVVVTLGPRGDGQQLVVLVVMPRERFSGEARDRIRELLAGRLGSAPLDDHLVFGEQDRAGRRLDPEAVGPRLIAALLALGTGRAENDTLNRLVVEAGLDWRAVACLRTYCGYAVQVGLATRPATLDALADHPEPARLLFARFAARFRPDAAAEDPAALRQRFVASLDGVQALREDLLLRALGDVVEATVRTNFYAPGPDPDPIALKIRPAH